jgi:16S rRNA A1518/A1519 N6-dimethyltransferase RsmA/KsgA/DIM1 with predicted DNA glycosylase/AP lyase activity
MHAKFDQNFTASFPEPLIKKISEFYRGKKVIEVGPGKGYFTEKLAEVSEKLILIEIDPLLATQLIKKGYSVINEDFNNILNLSFIKDYFLFSALPYSQLKNFFGLEIPINGFFIVPEYLKNNKGLFNTYFNYRYQFRIEGNLNRNLFDPIPQIDSLLIKVKDKQVISYSLFKSSFKEISPKKIIKPFNKRLHELTDSEITEIIKCKSSLS